MMFRIKRPWFVPNLVKICSIFLNLWAVKQSGPGFFAYPVHYIHTRWCLFQVFWRCNCPELISARKTYHRRTAGITPYHDPDVPPRWRTSHKSAGAGHMAQAWYAHRAVRRGRLVMPCRPKLFWCQFRSFWYVCFYAFDSRWTLLVHLRLVTFPHS